MHKHFGPLNRSFDAMGWSSGVNRHDRRSADTAHPACTQTYPVMGHPWSMSDTESERTAISVAFITRCAE